MHIVDGRIVPDKRHGITTDKARELKNYQLAEGDVVLGRRGEMGRCAVVRAVDDGFLCGTGSLIIRPGRSLSSDYLRLLLSSQAMVRTMERVSLGTTMPNLNQTIVANLPIRLPPLGEQLRIANILDQADMVRSLCLRRLSRVDRLSHALFSAMFGNPVRNERGWPQRSFGDVCDTRLGKMLDAKQQTGRDARPYLRNANVQWFRFDLTQVLEMDIDAKSRSLLRLEPGDVLICEGGEPGRSAIWRGERDEMYFQKALHRARPDQEVATPEFIAHQMYALAALGGLKDYVTSATIGHLTGVKLKSLPIIVPSLAVQKAFSEQLFVVDATAARARAALEACEELGSSLRFLAFSGEL